MMKTKHRRMIPVLLVVLLWSVSATIGLAAAEEPGRDVQIKRILVKDGEVVVVDEGAAVAEGRRLHRVRVGPDGGVTLPGVKRAFLGVHVIDLTEELRSHFGVAADRGVLVSRVSEGSPASKAGLRPGDLILTIQGEPVRSAGDLRRLIRGKESGSAINLETSRNGTRQTLFANLEEREMTLPPPPGLGPGMILRGERSEEAMKKVEELLADPDLQIRLRSIGDCAGMQERLERLQRRLAELERQLQKR
jgi:membrane-associated protease RseP (regulator of RpoE activity)